MFAFLSSDPYSTFILSIYIFIFSIYISILFFSIISGLSTNFIQYCGFYNMGKNLGFKNNFFAFIPVFSSYYHGKIADECTKRNGKRKSIFSLILPLLSVFAFFSVSILFLFLIIVLVDNSNNPAIETYFSSMDISTAGMIFLISLLVICIIHAVINIVANYQIYKCYVPKYPWVILLASLFINSFASKIVMLIISYQKPKPAIKNN